MSEPAEQDPRKKGYSLRDRVFIAFMAGAVGVASLFAGIEAINIRSRNSETAAEKFVNELNKRSGLKLLKIVDPSDGYGPPSIEAIRDTTGCDDGSTMPTVIEGGTAYKVIEGSDQQDHRIAIDSGAKLSPISGSETAQTIVHILCDLQPVLGSTD